MPAFNAARWIDEAVRSVLMQEGPSFELLVVDDGCTDATPELLARIGDPRLRTITQTTNQGLIAALNLGLAEARGQYVARLDADDVCKPGRLARQVAMLRRDAGTVMVSSFNELISEQGVHVAWSRWRFSPEAYYYLLHFRNCIGHSTVMFRRAAALQAGGYLHSYRRAEDFELWGRLSRIGRIVCIPEVLTAYRLHGASVSVREAEAQADMAALIARERLSALLEGPITPLLGTLYSEQAFRSAAPAELVRAGEQFVRALDAIWAQRPDYCAAHALAHFVAVEWARRSISFRRRGVALTRPRCVSPALLPFGEGALRGLLDEVHAPRLSALLPRTHP
jgi:glycosyltransferase involved in cell wall biosynthesis